MEKKDFVYEGKAKRVYTTESPDLAIVEYKDDATAFDGTKRGTIESKGIINNLMSAMIFEQLEKAGILTHFERCLDDRNMLVKLVQIIPIEVVVRNIVAGSLSKRLGLDEGTRLSQRVIELYYKCDELHDPMINEDHVLAMNLAGADELIVIRKLAISINEFLVPFFAKANLQVVDFKLEFGRFKGQIILADEISPDTCRLWDAETGEKLDKDRFRRDLGGETEAYIEVLNRLKGAR
ncbi:MAG: phosphoribosylaminoimidazolesuccinocarboxamide synthase [Syntrophomonadaceae bacterium]|nr:phosphoribosylaminoimidazolesuccinocarboxamide synthase [Syntrophomonadaceae bacterium]